MKKVNLTHWRDAFTRRSPFIFIIAACCSLMILFSGQVLAQNCAINIDCESATQDLGMLATSDIPPVVTSLADAQANYGMVTGISVSGAGCILTAADVMAFSEDDVAITCGAMVTRTIVFWVDEDGSGDFDAAIDGSETCVFTFEVVDDFQIGLGGIPNSCPPSPPGPDNCSTVPSIPTDADIAAAGGVVAFFSAAPYGMGFIGTPCGEVTATVSNVAEPADPCGSGQLIRSVQIFQDGNPVGQCTFTYNLDPAPAPTITAPADADVECFDDIMPDPADAMLSTATCNINSMVTVSAPTLLPPVTDGCPGAQYQVTYTVEDDCGNTDSDDQIFTLTGDTTPADPVITACAVDMMVACLADIDQAFIDAQAATIVFTTVCGVDATVTGGAVVADPGNDPCIDESGNIFTIEYTVEDDCGNTATCIQTITLDNVGLQADDSMLEDLVIECGDPTTYEQTIEDWITAQKALLDATSTTVCDATIIATNDNFDPADIPNLSCDQSVFLTVRFRVRDDCNTTPNRRRIDFFRNVIVDDNTPPAFTCPTDPVVVNGCGLATTIVGYPIDEAGAAIAPADIPTFEAELGITETCGLLSLEYIDVIDAAQTGCPNPRLVLTRTYTATDLCMQTATCAVTYSIEDTEGPMLTCPADVTTLVCGDVLPAPETELMGMDNCDGNIMYAVTSVDTPLPTSFCTADDRTVTRTYTAMDECGNIGTCVQTFTFMEDLTAPTPDMNPLDPLIDDMCNGNYPLPDLTLVSGTDNCTADADLVVTFVGDSAPVPAGCTESTTRTYNIADACGNNVDVTQVITRTIADATDPTITCPAAPPVIQGCDESDIAANAVFPFSTTVATISEADFTAAGGTVSDDCTIASITYIDVVTDDSCNPTIEVTRTFTVTDGCGNTAECEQIITIDDTTAPTITCPADLSLSGCDETVITAANASFDLSVGAPMGTPITEADFMAAGGMIVEPCEIISITYTDVVASTGCPNPLVTVTRTFTVTDKCGNTNSCPQEISIMDDEIPTFMAPAGVIIDCADDPLDLAITGDVIDEMDNCDMDLEATFADVVSADDPCAGSSVITRTWSLVDDCGNAAADQVQTITITDSTPPVIVCPADVPDLTCTDVLPGSEATATDNCVADADITITFTDDITIADIDFCVGGVITRTYMAEDPCGNVATTCEQTFTFLPGETTVVCPADALVACSADIVVDAANATTSSTCGITVTNAVTVSDPVIVGTPDCPGTTYTYTYSVTDDCGATATCEQVFTIDTGSDPVITTCPADADVTCSADIMADAAAVVFTTTCDVMGGATASAPVPAASNSACGETNGDQYTITYTVEDACGRMLTCDQIFTIVNTGLVVDCTALMDLTLECDMAADYDMMIADWIAVQEAAMVVTSSCTTPTITNDYTQGMLPAISCSLTAPTGLPVTFTITDECDNTQTCTVNIFLLDTTAPVVDCTLAEDLVLECGASGYDADITAWLAAQEEMLILNAVDACNGDLAEILNGTLTVIDPAVTVSNDYDFTTVLPVECMDGSEVGTPVVFTVTDICGNETTCAADIYLFDTTPPVAKLQEDIEDITGLTCADIALVDYQYTPEEVMDIFMVADACVLNEDITITYEDVPSYDPFTFCTGDAPHAITRTYTISDGCNETLRRQNFIFDSDNEPPVFTFCPSDLMDLACNEPLPPIVSGEVTATDNCTAAGDIIIAVSDDIAPETTIACLGAELVITRTYTATDLCGNSSTCVQMIAYAPDTEAPMITACPPDVTGLQCGDRLPDITPDYINTLIADGTLAATDNCVPDISLGYNAADDLDPADFSFCIGDANGTDAAGNPVFIVTRTFTVMDKCMNENTCTQQFIFDVDATPPVISCPADVTGLTPGTPLPVAEMMLAGTDNCDTATMFAVTDVMDEPLPVVYCPGADLTVERMYTVTDACGNEATCVQTFEYLPEENDPVVICPDDITVCADAGTCETFVQFPDLGISDECNFTIIGNFDAAGATFPVGVTPVSFTIIDANNNSTVCNFLVTVEDCEDPVITCPANIEVSADAGVCTANVTLPETMATDNCDTDVTITNDATSNVFPVGVTTVTYTATDDAGNTHDCTITVTVTDDELPTITCPANILLNTEDGVCEAVATWNDPATADNCGVATVVTDGFVSGDTFPLGTTTVTYTVTDVNGNVATCSFDVTVTDDENPVIECFIENIIVENFPGECRAQATWTDPVFSDNCPGVTMTSDYNSGDYFDVGSTAITFIATDASGNFTICKLIVVVEDTEAPVITCPAPPAPIANEPGQCYAIVNLEPATAIDNCDDAPIITASGVPSGNEFPLGTTTIVYTATDNEGNASTCSVDITVIDTEAPTVTCPADIVVSATLGQCDAPVTWTAPTASDNCPGVAIAGSHAPGDVFPVGTTTVTYTVTDAAGNVTTCDFNITVTDDEAPVFNCINGIGNNVELTTEPGICGATATWAPPVATDNCDVTITTSFPPGTIFPVGATAVTYTATDPSGNTAICKFVVIVTDEEFPTITCPADITGVSAEDGLCSAVVTWAEPVFDDNCPGACIKSTHNSGDAFPVGTTTVTYTVADFAGNETTCSFDITVEDNEAPEIFCPGDILITTAPGQCEAVLTWIQPTPTDNCDTDITRAVTHKPGTSFPIGTTTVIYTATDDAGNSSTCSFDVTVVDDEAPTMTCPTDIEVSADAGTCEATVSWAVPVVSDNCPGGVTLTSSHNPGDIFGVGTTTVTYTATDANGRITICSFVVTVNDDEAPPLTCPADITVSTMPGTCEAVVMWTAPEPVMGDCLGVGITVTSNFNPGDTFPIGTTSVIYSAVDGAGNQALCTFNVTVEDNEPPSVVECPSDIMMTAEPGMCSAIVEWTPPVPEPMDNCPGVVVVSGTHDSGDSFPLGTTMVTYTIQDASGNIVTCSFTVTITDDEDPTIACPADISVTNDVGECGAVVSWTAPIPQDNCPGATIITSSHNPGDFFPVGTTKVIYTIEDATGAVAQCSFFITVIDNNPVLLQCPADMVVDTDGGECTATVFWDAPLYIDNCDETNLSSSHEPGDVFGLGCTTVEYYVTQVIGGAIQVIETCSFEVCVEDNEAPTFDCPTNIVVLSDPGTCTAFVNWSIPTPSDNCPGAVISGFTHTPGQAFPIGTTAVIYTIDDANGNSDLCIFTVTVEDGSILDIECSDDITVAAAGGNCEAAVSWNVPVATGNCVGALTTTSTHNPGDIFPLGCTTVTYTVTDINNNSVQCNFDVCVEDNQGPVIINCPLDITTAASSALCGIDVVVPVPQFGIDYDDCTSATIINSMNATNDASGFYEVGVTTVAWTVTDADGNTATCEQKIEVIDDTDVQIVCPDDITVTTSPGNCTAIVAWDEPQASDNCSPIVSIQSSHNSGDAFPVGCTAVTYSVLGGGIVDLCSFNVCVEECSAGFNDITESIAPLISDQDVFVGGTDQQSFAANGVYTFTDPSTPASAALSNINLELFFRVQGASCESDIELQLTDPSGTVVFTGAPFTTCNGSGPNPIPGDLYNTNISIPSASTIGNPTNWIVQFRDTNDQNTGAVEYSVRFGRLTYDYTISVPVPGGCADPVIVNCPADITASAGSSSCGANLNIPAPLFGVDYTDCTNATITNSYTGTSNGSGFYPIGTTMVTWTVTDQDGNTVACEQTIMITDDVAPSITCPADVTASAGCDGIVTWSAPIISDNCGVASVTSTHNSGDAFAAGTTTVTYTVTDDNGNTATCSFDVTVTESTDLALVCPEDASAVTQPGQCTAVITWTEPTITGACGAAAITGNSHAPGMEFPIGCTTVTYTAADDSGNTVECSFEVCVDECTDGGTPTTTTTTTETITLIDDADAFIGFNDQESFASNTTYTFNDPGTPANAVLSNITLQLFFRVEGASCESEVEIRVSDPAGNVIYTGPMFSTCIGSGTHPAGDLYQNTIPLPGGAAMTTGTLSNWVVEFRDTNDQNTGANEYSVRFGRLIYDATITTQTGSGEGCGLPFIANCPANVTATPNANCESEVTIPAPVFGVDYLDCAGATIVNSYTGTADASSTYPLGTTVVIWTVTDTDGNVVACEQAIIVEGECGDTPELVNCPGDISLTTTPGFCGGIATWTPPTATGGTLTSTHNPGDEFPVGCTTVTYTIAGANVTCEFEVCVDECIGGGGVNIDETVTLISDSDLFIGGGDAESFASNGTYAFTDPGIPAAASISNATLQLFFRVENASCESDIEIRLTDPAGNVVYMGALFTTCMGSGANPFPGQLYTTTIPVTGGTTTGSAANWLLEFRDTNDQNTGQVEYSVRFGRLIYDALYIAPPAGDCGLPAIANCPADITVDADAGCEANIIISAPVFGVDYLDCEGATITNSYTGTSDASGMYPVGTTAVTWTVVDTDGNEVTCEQNITVLENGCNDGGGEFTSCPGNVTLTTTPGNCGAVASWTMPTISGGTLSSTHNPGEEFPVGCTTVTYTISGSNATCVFDVCVNECTGSTGETTTETITLIDDADAFIGFNDMESFSSNTTYTFNDPGTSANAVLSNITLQLFFRVEGASCENEIEIRVTDPAGNVVFTGPMFTTCNGSGTHPVGDLYQNTISLPGGTTMTTGNLDDWTIEFRDINDQNTGANEYSVRFGRLIYDATVTTPGMGGCADPVIVNCPADITADAPDGECEATVSVPVPQFGADFTDCTSATIANDYTGTADASGTYPAGTTMVTWTVTDAQGNTATCTQNITVNPGFIASDAVELISDSDLLIGGADTESFADNGVYLFTDPATPANAALSNIELLLFFRVENASCESDIEIRVTDPAGNVVYVGSPFTTCNGSGANPFPGQLYNTTISIPSASTTGSLANWTVEFRDTDDQNAGATEYSVRFGRINYDVGGALDCDSMVINQDGAPSVNSLMIEESELGHDIKLYPVPTMGRLTLEYTADEDEQIQVEIFNVNGQALRSIEQEVFEGVNTIDLEVYELPGGMYYVRTTDKLGTMKVKPFTKLAP